MIMGDRVPPVIPLWNGRDRVLAHKNSAFNVRGGKWDDEACWEDLQAPIAILKKVCPDAAKWVEEEHETNRIVWELRYSGNYASHHPITGIMTINRITFDETDGEKAVILAHEFRHSRQNLAKSVHEAMALILRGKQTDRIETDAYLFEYQVRRAIFD